MSLVVVFALASLTGPTPPAARGGDVPRDEPPSTLQATGETRVVFDQTGTQVWAVIDGWDLDQYLFRASSPLNFAIDVDRDFGPVDASGHPAPGNVLYGLTGRISLRVFDVDDDAATNPEVDEVYVNGFLLGTLTGANDQWSVNTFEFPLTQLRLPTTENPTGRNEFEVLIDTTNGGWAVEVAWAELRLKEDFVPLALIHGFTSTGDVMGDFRDFMINAQAVQADEVVTPTHTSANLQSGATEIAPPIDNLQLATGGYHVNVIAHSYGGLVARLYAWDNPSRVDKLILIGTPNGGSELADAACLFKNTNGPWAGLLWAAELFDDQIGNCHGPQDGLFQMQTDYVRNVFNAQVPDRNGTQYWTISGIWDDPGRPFDFFPGADDGWVTLESSQYLSIGIPDHPGQHRLLGTIPFEHGAMIQPDSEAMPLSACELYDVQCVGSSSVQLATAGAADFVLGRFGGVQVPAGGNGLIDLAFEGAPTASIVLISDQLNAITPTFPGATFAPAKFLEANVLAANLSSPTDGQLQITNSGTDLARVVALVGVPAVRSVSVEASDDLIAQGATVDFTVGLTQAGTGEQVAAEVRAPSGATTTINLSESSPGTWTGSFTAVEPGVHDVAAWVDGDRPRYDSTLFSVASGQSQLTGVFAERLEGAEDGLADALVISPEITVPVAGNYRLTAQLSDATGAVIATAGATAAVPAGTSALDLAFPGRAIFDSGVGGPYQVVDVVLSRDDAAMTLEDAVENLGQTAAYDHATFDHFPVAFDLDGFSDEAVDIDADGVFDELRVSGSATVDVAGNYAINARLVTPGGIELAEFQTTTTMTSGENNFTLAFDGEPIGASGRDGPYVVADLSVYATADVDVAGYLITAHETAAYTAAQFGAVSVTTERISLSSAGDQATALSEDPSVSADGRYVAFSSPATNLVSGDTNGREDIFVHDRQTGVTSRVSIGSGGSQANDYSFSPSISADGRYVAFASRASNLVTNDTNGTSDVFVHDRQAGVTTRVSITSDGTQANGWSGNPSISNDGRVIAFDSGARNLGAYDRRATQIFAHDRETGLTTPASIAADGSGQNGGGQARPAISGDGRYVAWDSTASNLVPGTPCSRFGCSNQIYVRDLQAGVTTRVSVASDGTVGNNLSQLPSISGDGRYVAFESDASNLVPGQSVGFHDIFVHDRVLGTTTRVSVASDGTPADGGRSQLASISDDGRFIAFSSSATNLVVGDTNGAYDVFVHDRTTAGTIRVSVGPQDVQGNGSSFTARESLSGDGSYLAFESQATNLVANDTNAVQDVFVRGRLVP